MEILGLNKLCIDIDEDLDFDEIMRKAANEIGSIDIDKMENELYKAWINSNDFELEFEYHTDYGKFYCRLEYTCSCIFVESDNKHACIEVTEIIEEIIRGFITC